MLKDNFCSSPWFHLAVSPNGTYRPCRWISQNSNLTIQTTSLREYFNSPEMNSLRSSMLSGEKSPTCQNCYYESSQGKVSGKTRQLLKSSIVESNFEKTFCASPHWKDFEYSHSNQGLTQTNPVDLQIDLGSVCNSSCIMCPPEYTTRGLVDQKKLHELHPDLFRSIPKSINWTDDTQAVDKFVDELSTIENLRYIHFLGGETLYLKSFYDICQRLIDTGQSKHVVMGTTTNCTIYDDRILNIIDNFKQVHLGLSIESYTDLNDYVRWPSKIDSVLANVKKFLALRQDHNLQISLRITPSVLTIWNLDLLIEFMIENHVIAESCNIMSDPKCLRMELLPENLRIQIIDKFDNLIEKYQLQRPQESIVNRRRQDLIDPVIANIAFEYRDFLTGYQAPIDLEQSRQDLVRFLKSWESLRNNSILDHLPEYEEFLRSYGY